MVTRGIGGSKRISRLTIIGMREGTIGEIISKGINKFEKKK